MSTYYTTVGADGSVKERLRSSRINTISSATSLTKANDGDIIELSAAAGAAINLPAVADIDEGWKVKVYVGAAFATTNWTIVSATDVIQGHALVDGAHIAASDENTISFVASAENVGDFVEVFFDGTNFITFGSGVASGSITFTAP